MLRLRTRKRDELLTLLLEHPLTDKQRAAVSLVGAGVPMSEIAERLQVPLAQLWEWRLEPSFQSALRAQYALIQQWAQDRIAGMVDTALKTVQDCLSDDKGTVRLMAAKMILDRALGERVETEAEMKAAQRAFQRDFAKRMLQHLQEGEFEDPKAECARMVKLLGG